MLAAQMKLRIAAALLALSRPALACTGYGDNRWYPDLGGCCPPSLVECSETDPRPALLREGF